MIDFGKKWVSLNVLSWEVDKNKFTIHKNLIKKSSNASLAYI
jgi:hypothetical protein